MKRFGFAFALALLLPALVGLRGLRQQVQLRVEGFLDANPAEVHPWATVDVKIGSERQTHKFALVNIVSLSVGGPTGADIIEQVMPIHPNFIWNGDQKLLDQIAAAKPNQYVKIVGYTAFGVQRLLIQTVEISEPITGPTPTPSLRHKILGF
ncbi:MAG: hypothetical protein RL698_2843 [Pseudomonadota bacterium]|jgi:hypothetical protein